MATARIGGVFVYFCATLLAQEAAEPPTFEVAAIKPSPDPPGSSGIFESQGRINAKNVTLRRCVRGAYDVPEPQVLGGPKWVDEDRYYIEAKAAGPAGDHDLMLMLQTLLADRFKLVIHREQRSIVGYRLALANGGLKAQTSSSDRGSVGHSRRGHIDAQAYTMTQLALHLSELLNRPVLDMTGVPGEFDFKLDWTPDDMQSKPLSGDQHSASAPDSGTPCPGGADQRADASVTGAGMAGGQTGVGRKPSPKWIE
jgi:uncharacterized protein (TIGR03435 family)